jgi:hypothetical protein
MANIPPEAKESDIVLKKGKFIGPGGLVFGKPKNKGLFNIGATSIGTFIANNPNRFTGTPPSLVNIMRAVSPNEGLLEAINTWDNAFLSFGIYQWTAGAGTGEGELVDFLDRLKSAQPSVFDTYFGANGLGLKIAPATGGAIRRGFLLLDGTVLNTLGRKAAIRKPIWAYRFWRAGHDDDVRTAQITHGMARIKAFYRVPSTLLKGKSLSDFITSEVGVAHLLDQHINRPGHVPRMMADAINKFVKSSGKPNPASWTDADERRIIDDYLVARRTDPRKSKMTDSKNRASRIDAFVAQGVLSPKRGSFVAPA